VSKLSKTQDKFRKRFNEGYAKVGRKNGFTVQEGVYENLELFKGGSFDRMNHVFTSGVMTIHVHTNALMYTAHGLMKSVVNEPLKCYCGVLIDKPVPATLYVKQIRDGIRKKQTWIPFHKDVRAAEVYKGRMNWNSLLDELNGDKELRSQLGKINVENEINGIGQDLSVGRYSSLPVKVSDQDDNHNTVAQIIPMGDSTLIVTQHVNEKPQDIEPALKTIKRIYQIFDGYNYGTPTKGVRFRDWPDEILEKIEAARPKTAAPEPVPAPPSMPPRTLPVRPSETGQALNVCQNCGASNPGAQKFCGDCGSPLEPPRPVCSKCGAENPPGHKFCGECGNSLESTGAPETPQPPGVSPDMNDPIEPEIAKIRGGRSVEWKMRFQTEKSEYEAKAWNLANEYMFLDYEYIRGLGKLIGANDHYQIFSVIKYVTAPTGQKMTGGWMDLVTFFKSNAPPNLRNRKIQVLIFPREVEQVTTHVRLIASTEQNMDLSTFREILDVVANKPDQVESFYIYGPID